MGLNYRRVSYKRHNPVFGSFSRFPNEIVIPTEGARPERSDLRFAWFRAIASNFNQPKSTR